MRFVAKMRDECRAQTPRSNLDTKRRRRRGGHVQWIGDSCKVDESSTIRKGPMRRFSHWVRDGCLADSAGSDDRRKTLTKHQSRQHPYAIVPANHSRLRGKRCVFSGSN
jgi:hypothetical protein